MEAYITRLPLRELIDGPVAIGVKPTAQARALINIANLIFIVDTETGAEQMLFGRRWLTDTKTFINSEQPNSLRKPCAVYIEVDFKTDEREVVAAMIKTVRGYYDDPREPVEDLDSES